MFEKNSGCQKATAELMITNNVDEAVLLSDRIFALGRGPAATLSGAVAVNLPRPRSTDLMLHDDEAVRVRAQVTEFLTANSRPGARNTTHKQAGSVPVEV